MARPLASFVALFLRVGTGLLCARKEARKRDRARPQKAIKVMIRFSAILAGVLAVALAACGGATEAESDMDLYETDFDSVEQPLFSHTGFGVNLNASQHRCFDDDIPDSQNCVFPADKTITVKVTDDGINATEKSALQAVLVNALNSWNAQVTGWSLTAPTSGNQDMHIRYGTLSGNTGTSIFRYARVTTFNTSAPLTEPHPEVTPGTYRKWSGTSTCTIDKAKIDANFATTAQRNRVRAHGVYFCAQKAFGLGHGVSSPSRSNATVVTPDADKSLTLSNRIKCYMNGFDQNNGGNEYRSNIDCNNVAEN